MKTFSQDKGDRGEFIACSYLRHEGYQIIETKYHSRWGEVDIIARKKHDELIFFEVKYYKKESLVHPLQSITENKQRKMMLTLEKYLSERDIVNEDYRVDLIIVEREIVTDHIQNIF